MDENDSINNMTDGSQPQSAPSQPVPPQPDLSQSEPVQPVPPQSVTQAQPQPVIKPVQSVQPLQPVQAQPQQNSPIGSTPDSIDGSGKQKKHNKSIIAAIVTIVIVIIIVVVVVIIALSGGNNGAGANVSMDTVKSYCEKNEMEIDTSTTETEPKMEYLICYSANEPNNDNSYHSSTYLTLADSDYMTISFGVADKSLMEYQEFVAVRDQLMDSGVVLENSDNYLKIYIMMTSSTGAYLIISDNTYMQLMASDDVAARAALIEIGYPDRNWPTEQDTYSSSTTQVSQKDTQRRNDLARVDTSLVQYQTNHIGEANTLPMGPSYWEGETTFNCNSSNVACQFVRDYMNNTKDNIFTDPDGVPYSLYISENWFENNTITPTFGNNDSYLIKMNEGYTIGGDAPFGQHVIYVVPGGKCDGSMVVKADRNRHFAIMYQLEDNSVYCIDDQ